MERMSLLICSRSGVAMAAGASAPNQVAASKFFMLASANVGISGTFPTRLPLIRGGRLLALLHVASLPATIVGSGLAPLRTCPYRAHRRASPRRPTPHVQPRHAGSQRPRPIQAVLRRLPRRPGLQTRLHRPPEPHFLAPRG